MVDDDEDGRARALVESWSTGEQEAVSVILGPELATGWIPTLADLEAAIAVIRTQHLHLLSV